MSSFKYFFVVSLIIGFVSPQIGLAENQITKSIGVQQTMDPKGYVIWQSLKNKSTLLKIEFEGTIFESDLQIKINSKMVAQVPVKKGKAKLKLKSEKGDQVPEVKVGDKLEVVQNGKNLVVGTFEERSIGL